MKIAKYLNPDIDLSKSTWGHDCPWMKLFGGFFKPYFTIIRSVFI